jgi:hypothetical protein
MNDGNPLWSAIRDAMRDWGTTARLCTIWCVIESPLLIMAIARH